MPNQQLLDFIKNEVIKGTPRSQIKTMLVQNGWTSTDVESAFIALEIPHDSSTPIINPVASSAFNPGANNISGGISTNTRPASNHSSKLIVGIIITVIAIGVVGAGVWVYLNSSAFSQTKITEQPPMGADNTNLSDPIYSTNSAKVADLVAKPQEQLPDISEYLSQLASSTEQFTSIRDSLVKASPGIASTTVGLKQQIAKIKALGTDQKTISKFNLLYSALVEYGNANESAISTLNKDLNLFDGYRTDLLNRTMTIDDLNTKMNLAYSDMQTIKTNLETKVNNIKTISDSIKSN